MKLNKIQYITLLLLGCIVAAPLHGMAAPVAVDDSADKIRVMMNTDHYAILGIPHYASRDEVKNAYRRLSLVYHPDKGGNATVFQRVDNSYKFLMDPFKKFEYDLPWSLVNKWTIGAGLSAMALYGMRTIHRTLFRNYRILKNMDRVAHTMVEQLYAGNIDRYQRSKQLPPLMQLFGNEKDLIKTLSSDQLRLSLVAALYRFDQAFDYLFNAVAWSGSMGQQTSGEQKVALARLVQQRLQELELVVELCLQDLGYNQGFFAKLARTFSYLAS